MLEPQPHAAAGASAAAAWRQRARGLAGSRPRRQLARQHAAPRRTPGAAQLGDEAGRRPATPRDRWTPRGGRRRDRRQRQRQRRQVDLRSSRRLRYGHRQPAGRRPERPALAQLRAQRAFQVQQAAVAESTTGNSASSMRPASSAAAISARASSRARRSAAVAMRRARTRARPCGPLRPRPAPAPRRRRPGRRPPAVSQAVDAADHRAAPPVRSRPAPPPARSRSEPRGLARHAGGRQVEREVAAVQASGEARRRHAAA